MLRVWFALALAACGSKKTEEVPVGSASGSVSPAVAAKTALTPRGFLNRGTPTYIAGTAGDDASDRGIAGQVDLMRSLLTPDAKRIADTDVDPKQGPAAWPQNPMIYGGAHVNALVAAIAPDLPFTVTAGKIAIGDRTFEGDGLALIVVVPARAGKYPDFVLFAGTGTPGVAEINAPHVMRVDAPIVIADAFGPLVVGSWKADAGGVAVPQLGQPGRRVGWRETRKDVGGIAVTFRFYDKADATLDGPAIERATRGIEKMIEKLGLAKGAGLAMTIYVHPDQRSKQSLTGNGGAGHAVAFAKTLHVYDSGAGFEELVAHEGSHAITPQLWPPPGSPLFGEGVAVWIAGGYAGKSLAELRTTTPKQGPIKELLGSKFRKLREVDAYPIGGILVEIAVQQVGLANVRDHLYGATTATWDEACKRAGTTAETLDAALAAALAN
jgi:hypothetical protein